MKLLAAGAVITALAFAASIAAAQDYGPPPAQSQPSDQVQPADTQLQPAEEVPAQTAPEMPAATSPTPTKTADGIVQAISLSCSSSAPDSCSALIDVVAGFPASNHHEGGVTVAGGYGIRIFVPAGTPVMWGNAQVPVTRLEVGDQVRIDYAMTGSGGIAVNMATSTRLIAKPRSI